MLEGWPLATCEGPHSWPMPNRHFAPIVMRNVTPSLGTSDFSEQAKLECDATKRIAAITGSEATFTIDRSDSNWFSLYDSRTVSPAIEA
jgi:hypothetical protein